VRPFTRETSEYEQLLNQHQRIQEANQASVRVSREQRAELELEIVQRRAASDEQRGALEDQRAALEDQRAAVEKKREVLEKARETLENKRALLEKEAGERKATLDESIVKASTTLADESLRNSNLLHEFLQEEKRKTTMLRMIEQHGFNADPVGVPPSPAVLSRPVEVDSTRLSSSGESQSSPSKHRHSCCSWK
jgi:multidrug efflux pump subunit AcrA (membrane-fusion protein)